MRDFQRLGTGLPLAVLAHQVTRAIPELFKTGYTFVPLRLDNGGFRDTDFMRNFVPQTKGTALGIMQMVGGSILGGVNLYLIGFKESAEIKATENFNQYLAFLRGDASINGENETVQPAENELWWCRNSPLQISNRSDDDLVLMSVEVRIDP